MSIIDIWEIIINFDLFKLPALIATITITIIFFIAISFIFGSLGVIFEKITNIFGKTLSWFLLIFLIIIIYFLSVYFTVIK
tara:strand:- start:162 stop:404 length:243 start_codon:yes stop_codon:yes gene_type:complete